jgi:two-component system OmpR family sensor kinase
MTSLRARLLAALIGTLLAAGGLAAAATYFSARAEVSDMLDEELRQVALAVRDYTALDLKQLAQPDVDPAYRVNVQIWDVSGASVYFSNTAAPLPFARQPGYGTVRLNGEQWRTYTAFFGLRAVQTSQPTKLRTELAARAAMRILFPVLAAAPLLAALVWLIVGRGLAPLGRLAQALARRGPHSVEPLPEAGLPGELAPLVKALNGLLARLGEAFDAQRRFAADAAHELRTPLTALGLQLQLLERADTPEARATQLARLGEGVKRATRLVQQLLTLARVEPDAAEHRFAPVALDALARTVAADFAPVAAAKPVALELDARPAQAAGTEDALRILVANLVDNAIRYTPAHGRVLVRTSTDASGATLEVADDGPGIPPEERERVFDRFYRGNAGGAPGSGLGLSIVRRIADLHGARITLSEGLDGRGLTVRVVLAVAGSAPP